MTDKKQKIQKDRQKKQENCDLWSYATKDVTPLKDKNVAKNNKEQIEIRKLNHNPPMERTNEVFTSTNTYIPPELKSTDTDHRTSQRLKRGQLPIDGRIDLHGNTQSEAYDALLNFIPSSYHQGKRCVLVITGKGSRKGTDALSSTKIGVLKMKTPEWLQTPPLNSYVLKIETARQNHGGEGALYVLLRRKR